MNFSKYALAVVVLVIGGGAAMATDAKTASVKVHSPASIECSKQADVKGLHGKERKTFRATCKKQIEGAKTTTTKKPDDKAIDKKS